MPELTNKAKHVGNSRSWPVKALAWFILVTVALFSLILFTGDRQAAPRLGIDLQGGTRVTLVPQGDEPTQDQLDQARAILELTGTRSLSLCRAKTRHRPGLLVRLLSCCSVRLPNSQLQTQQNWLKFLEIWQIGGWNTI